MKIRSGQVALYLVMVLVAIMFLVLTNVSAFLAVRAKNRATNASDAAALAAARVQGELLNRIGRLNLEHAVSDYLGNYARSLEIVREQRRLAFLGPFDCLRAANDAARANGAKESAEMSAILAQHVSDIHAKYMQYPELYPEPWEGAWNEYASELASIVSGGIFAGPDNIDFVDLAECFPLTSKSFYKMIAGRSWCRIKTGGWQWVLNCNSQNMPRPAENEQNAVVNCEICSLHLAAPRPLPDMSEAELAAFREFLARNGAEFPLAGPAKDNRPPDDPSRCYFFYDFAGMDIPEERMVWRKWREIDVNAEGRNFPVVGRVKPEFDVLGCTVVFRVCETISRFLSDSSRTVEVNVAAKPFGTIETSGGRSVVTDEEAFGLVLPAYEAVRLIPVAAANRGGGDPSTADASWLSHIREHIAQYLSQGTEGLPGGCFWCQQLIKWEPDEFRAQVARELQGLTCDRPVPGQGPGGGANPPR